MAILKCKMCGGTIEFVQGTTVGECQHCGTKQTLPNTSNEGITNLYNRANNLRLKCDFDKAMAVYEKIVEQDDSQAEAHWGIVLCKYGIEYVDDPSSHTKIPTCHRTLYNPVIKDTDYQAAIDFADNFQQSLYEKEARAIDKIQKNIIAIVQKEEPFDVFICYKETDENGKRTKDSVLANDIYHQLTQENYKVFYAAITLEDKLGQEYEPYIFAALNTAKVMLVVGTNPEYFNSVWVKNEWSRFMSLMNTDRTKLLIPCYRDMDPYDLPEEFKHLQAQDMSKIGFIQDLLRGIKKIIQSNSDKEKEVSTEKKTNNKDAGVKNGFMLLEAGLFDEADVFFKNIIDKEPKNGMAYLGKLMSEMQIKKIDDLSKGMRKLEDNKNYNNVLLFNDADMALQVKIHNEVIVRKRKLNDYDDAVRTMNAANTERQFKSAAAMFRKLGDFNDSKELALKCEQIVKAFAVNEPIYNNAISLISSPFIDNLNMAISELERIKGWRNSEALIEDCRKKIADIKQSNKTELKKALFGISIVIIIVLILIAAKTLS